MRDDRAPGEQGSPACERARGRRPSSPPVNLSQAEQWTGFLLHRVASLARDLYSRRTQQLELRPLQVGILQLLQGSGPMVQVRIAEALGVDKPAMVALINEMEQGELVKRIRHPEDGRALTIHLSDRGEALLQRMEEMNHQASEILFAPLSCDERKDLHRLLMKIYRSATSKSDFLQTP